MNKLTTYAFIDSQNLNLSIKKLGWKMDWRKFRKFLENRYGVSKAFMFIGYIPEQEKMYQQLHEAGYMVVLKPTYDMTKPYQEAKPNDDTKPDEDKHIKGNIDADLVLWAMKEINSYKKAVIVSGDGDFYSLVEYLEENNKLLKLLAPSGYYSKLYNRIDKYIDRIDKSKKDLVYFDRKSRPSKKQ